MGIYVVDYLIVFIGLLSIFDLYCTLGWIGSNPYMEANPLMRWLWVLEPWLFVLFKFFVTLVFCLVGFKYRDNRLFGRLIWLPFCIYGVVCFIHLI
jgi:hypothetical protein